MTDERYNIIWVTLDSLKATALPVYGNPFVKAPAAVRAAENGVVFSHAFAQMPKCVPSRPSMISGRYPHSDGLRALRGKASSQPRHDRLRSGPLPKDEALRGKASSQPRHDLFVLAEGQPNMVTFLKERGYVTCAKGPNHMVSWDVYEEWFDVTTDWERRRNTSRPPGPADPESIRAQYAGAVPEDYDMERHPDAESTRQLCEFLAAQKERPFLAFLDIRAPHPPYREWPPYAAEYAAMEIPPPPKSPIEEAPQLERFYRETYDLEGMGDAFWRRIVRAYYSMISFDDALVGRVLDEVARLGLEDRTIVIYSADHGDFAGEHGCIEKHDPFLYDCLVRLPLVMQLPAGLPRGKRIECLAELVDIVPTLAELCGFEVPRWVQGRSLLPLITGEAAEHKDAVFAQGGVEEEAIKRLALVDPDFFYSTLGEQFHLKQKVILDHPEFMTRSKMVRTREHKYIYRLSGCHEFYDLVRDPGELKNEVDNPAYSSALDDLRERLIRWMLESETNLPLIDQVWA